MGLPAGQDVTKKLGIPEIPGKKLLDGKVTANGAKTNKPPTDIFKD